MGQHLSTNIGFHGMEDTLVNVATEHIACSVITSCRVIPGGYIHCSDILVIGPHNIAR